MRELPDAILLLGPTGSGKTPLGQALQARGLGGRRCAHFDFGEHLRQAVAGGLPGRMFTRSEIDFLRRVLESGALLEDRDFPLAERILRSFLETRSVGGDTWVVLNGLPRHLGQAESLSRILRVVLVVCLECSAATVAARIASDTGGDRAGRADDALPAIERKLALYAERTAPLVAHYAARGSRIVRLQVTSQMTGLHAWQQLQQQLGSRFPPSERRPQETPGQP